eukprot:scaffold12296_cov27-Tisochrysis_lutea.AAC.7
MQQQHQTTVRPRRGVRYWCAPVGRLKGGGNTQERNLPAGEMHDCRPPRYQPLPMRRPPPAVSSQCGQHALRGARLQSQPGPWQRWTLNRVDWAPCPR